MVEVCVRNRPDFYQYELTPLPLRLSRHLDEEMVRRLVPGVNYVTLFATHTSAQHWGAGAHECVIYGCGLRTEPAYKELSYRFCQPLREVYQRVKELYFGTDFTVCFNNTTAAGGFVGFNSETWNVVIMRSLDETEINDLVRNITADWPSLWSVLDPVRSQVIKEGLTPCFGRPT